VRFALGLEYDGSDFRGWQSQPDGNTVQDTLEAALARIAGVPVRTCCAGRTDAGVHACWQVVHFDTDVERPLGAWVRGVNSCLPESIAVRWARSVPGDFHARYRALARRYTYLLCNGPVRPALWANRVGWHHAPLRIESMQRAARLLEGEHDFSAFRAAECQARNPVRTLSAARVEASGGFVRLSFRANAFLHHMVRNMVGALVEIGKGRRPVEWIGQLLAGADRSQGAATFSPAGLYLSGVEYDPHWQLPEFVPSILPAASIS
jgi:tRNA pseudouridine38-40 synthase